MAGLWAKLRDELGSDPFLTLALLAALIAIATHAAGIRGSGPA